MDNDYYRSEIFDDVSVKRFGHPSLYSWMRNNVTDRLLRRRNQLVNISLIREDGFNLSYDIINSNYDNPSYDELNVRKINYRVEEAINVIKSARMHERMMLYLRMTGIDIAGNHFDDEEAYILIRFADIEYNHPAYGPSIKQAISAEQISLKYIKDYTNHFTISGKISDIVKNKKLVSIISLNQIDNEKYRNLKENLGDDHPSVLEINKSLIDIYNLSIIYNALSDKEKDTLRQLPFLGHPNYLIDPDLKLKIYLKSSTAESFGNGNAIAFYLS